MPEAPYGPTFCTSCGSSNTTIRSIDVHDRKIWVECTDCQRYGHQPYPDTNEATPRGGGPTDPTGSRG